MLPFSIKRTFLQNIIKERKNEEYFSNKRSQERSIFSSLKS